jgi:NADH-quinone oxidoreductase subunit C
MDEARARQLLSGLPGVVVAEGGPIITADVPVEQFASVGAFAKDTLGCRFFAFLTAIDLKEAGLEVVARVDNLESKVCLMLRTKLGPGNTRCPSLFAVFRGANWMERECFDMFGIVFDGHPDLRRMLLPEDWVGHPLLKSYAVDTPYPPYR